MTTQQSDNVQWLAETLGKTSEKILEAIAENPDINSSVVLLHANKDNECMISAIARSPLEGIIHMLTSWAEGDPKAYDAIILAAAKLVGNKPVEKLKS